MKRSLLVSLILMVGVMPSSSAQPQADSFGGHPLLQDPGVDASFKVLDAWIKATMRNREQPGLSIGIVHDQNLIWAKGYGFADIANEVSATPSTRYRIASISKLFTTTAIMQIRDAGKLQLDDPVAKGIFPGSKLRISIRKVRRSLSDTSLPIPRVCHVKQRVSVGTN